MNSKTSLVAKQYRLQEWAMQIKDCQNRPKDMTVKEWCNQNGMTKPDYYYRMRRVREACLDSIEQHDIVALPSIVEAKQELPVKAEIIMVSIGSVHIHVDSNTSMPFFKQILEAIKDVE